MYSEVFKYLNNQMFPYISLRSSRVFANMKNNVDLVRDKYFCGNKKYFYCYFNDLVGGIF